MQMQWAERDSYTMRRLKPYLGKARWERLYAAGGLEAAGARLCGGSDWPVDPLLPFRQIEMAVNRTADEVYKGDDEPLNPEQSISLRSSIAMHTRNSAYQLHQGGVTGQIRTGLRADLVVLDSNLFDVQLTDVSTTEVMLTMVDGAIVHQSRHFELTLAHVGRRQTQASVGVAVGALARPVAGLGADHVEPLVEVDLDHAAVGELDRDLVGVVAVTGFGLDHGALADVSDRRRGCALQLLS